MKKFYRALIVIFAFFLIGMTLLTVRFIFDRRDMKKACQMVMEYRPREDLNLGLTLAQIMSFERIESPVFCEARLISRYEKKLIVNCQADIDSASSFTWLVDLAEQSVLPEGESAKALLVKAFQTIDVGQTSKF